MNTDRARQNSAAAEQTRAGRFYPLQKNEDQRLQAQLTQLNQENCGMAQSLLALDRSPGVLYCVVWCV